MSMITMMFAYCDVCCRGEMAKVSKPSPDIICECGRDRHLLSGEIILDLSAPK